MQRIALISGSTGGLGSALARKMASAGYRLALHYFQHVEEANALLDTDPAIKEKLFLYLLQKREETAIASISTTSNYCNFNIATKVFIEG